MKSIWTETAALPAFSVLEGHQRADVAVIGGGLAGMLTAAALRREDAVKQLTRAKKLALIEGGPLVEMVF